jgi:hypothetical protein
MYPVAVAISRSLRVKGFYFQKKLKIETQVCIFVVAYSYYFTYVHPSLSGR